MRQARQPNHHTFQPAATPFKHVPKRRLVFSPVHPAAGHGASGSAAAGPCHTALRGRQPAAAARLDLFLSFRFLAGGARVFSGWWNEKWNGPL